ncbi:MAG: alpha-1,2-fucosyltransferase [Synechococcaceae cyanobacterium]|nr:alpha-1,2-fucosyltransferase [Synechococcaceae cyanobacterium]
MPRPSREDAPRVICRLRGGLGNQLFIYAAARRLALVSQAELVLDDVSGFQRDHLYRRHNQLQHFHVPVRSASPAERLEPLARLRRPLARWRNRMRPFAQRTYLEQEGVDFDPRLLALRVRRRLHLDGLWQSEGYFADVAATIRADLRIRPPQDSRNRALAERIRGQRSASLHYRCFHPPAASGPGAPSVQADQANAPAAYYARAIALLEQQQPVDHYYVFSDRPDQALASLPLPAGRFTLVSHNRGDSLAHADLWLMSLCQHAIIANSTFSWWGAWLASRPGQRVVAPGFTLRQGIAWWGFDGLLPDRWLRA